VNVAPDTRKRAWLAAVLAFAQPGLGHVYLRSWLRAVLWFGLWAATIGLVVELPAAGGDPVAFLSATVGALGELPLRATLALASVTVFCVLDAYWLAARNAASRDQFAEEPTCPECGQDVDPTLEFCHWCTAEFPEEADPTGDRGPETH